MHSASVTELKAKLSAYLHKVKSGSEVQVTERGIPIARLVPITALEAGDDVRERLVRQGVIVPGRGDLSWVLDTPPLEVGDADLVGAIIEDREDRV